MFIVWMKGWVVGWMGEQMSDWTKDEGMDGWMCGWISGFMDGWMDGHLHSSEVQLGLSFCSIPEASSPQNKWFLTQCMCPPQFMRYT